MSKGIRDALGSRMKENYENISKTKLMRRTPVAIRLDGCHFHTFTKNFDKPFDRILIDSMQETMMYLCENIQGCVFGYTQSDEITLILIDYQKLESAAWFDNEVQKICSVSASMCTMMFNKLFTRKVENYNQSLAVAYNMLGEYGPGTPEYKKADIYLNAAEKGAYFDARAFNIPREEVANLILWRELDAMRNSVQMVGRANFSHKELQNLSCTQIKDKLIKERQIYFDEYPIYTQRGAACIKDITTGNWILDKDIPVLKGEHREYIERFINVGEER